MFSSIYIEEEVKDHPRVLELTQRFPKATKIPCERYGEVFNRKGQNFRLQKNNPSLILAKKYGEFCLKTPEGYGVGCEKNYYFSHLFNCPFDCRYCYLQGVFRSAHYVLFVNYEDFAAEIEEISDEKTMFFSGYDADSLAFEGVSHFADYILDRFQRFPSFLELRTKSVQIKSLLRRSPMDNVVVAFTLSPQEVVSAIEHKTPSLESRLEAIEKLAERGWKIGLRFDPVIACKDYETIYGSFFDQVYERIPTVHSTTLGPFRLPKGVQKEMVRLWPEEKLFAFPGENEEMMQFCQEKVDRWHI